MADKKKNIKMNLDDDDNNVELTFNFSLIFTISICNSLFFVSAFFLFLSM